MRRRDMAIALEGPHSDFLKFPALAFGVADLRMGIAISADLLLRMAIEAHHHRMAIVGLRLHMGSFDYVHPQT